MPEVAPLVELIILPLVEFVRADGGFVGDEITDEALVARSATLCLVKADCHKALGETKSELVALDGAFKADPSRWQTLIRIIWCANNCDRPQVIRWALSRLKADFPDRHAAFVGDHDWIRYVA